LQPPRKIPASQLFAFDTLPQLYEDLCDVVNHFTDT
jgi:hypothetical protein